MSDTTDPPGPVPAGEPPEAGLPMDMDVDERDRTSALRQLIPVVGVVALGGALGAAARYGALLLWPPDPAGFAWATYFVNAVGCAVMGVVVVVFMELRRTHPLVRPFLATGFLGGFTTLSTYAADTERMARLGSPGTALLYFAATPLTAIGAVAATSVLTRRIAARRRAGAVR
ncbi:CrcB family protein [Streptomyces wuyuanensis]|uniref:FluC/FEX family fluoride channel n=1 Tax=Streptomyces wuyuanensis TaxID=1196353 RepID=UPI00371D39DE